MDRTEALERMQEYVDGEIADPAEEAAMRRLIDSDAELEKAYRHAKKYTTTMLEALSPLRQSDVFDTKLMERIHSGRHETTRPGDKAERGTVPGRVVLWPYAVSAAVMLAITLALLLARGESSLGHVESISGRVTLVRKLENQEQREAAVAGQALQSGDVLELGEGAEARIVVADNSLHLSAGTEIHVYREQAGARLFLTRGGVELETASGAGPVILQAGRVVAQPEPGSRLDFRIIDGQVRVRVTVHAGSVEVLNISESQKLQAGQEAILGETGRIEVESQEAEGRKQ